MNLAIVECGLGERGDAVSDAERLLEFSPDDQKAKTMVEKFVSGSQKCDGHENLRLGGIWRVNICTAIDGAPSLGMSCLNQFRLAQTSLNLAPPEDSLLGVAGSNAVQI